MSRVSPAQNSFNGGAISPRLRARIDQSIYEIATAEMVGFAPLVEGPMEAMPGTIHVAQAPGPCRLIRFEPSKTLGHVVELSEGLARVYTNDALVTVEGEPLEIASPYSYAQVKQLRTHESYDVMYCWHREKQPREFVRTGAAEFAFSLLELEGGPFEPRNTNKSIRVTASTTRGAVTLTASTGIFEAGDVGGLFRLEVEDFGDVTAWEPYITVTQGQLLTFDERVYRVVGGNGAATSLRTGGLSPQHTEGVEWDGIAKGKDINDQDAAGVRLEYMHDHYGIVKITGFTSATVVTGTVERTLPFSVANADYSYTGGYWDDEYDVYVPPTTTVGYGYGTYRWAFGSFSDRRGWPTCGVVWNERLCLAKDNVVYTSVAADLTNFAELNERGQASDDMAIIAIVDDANPIEHLVPEDRLLALTASGVHAVGPDNAATGLAPGKVRAERQNDAGCLEGSQPVRVNSRTIYVDRSGRRIYETDFDAGRSVEQELDLTRYSRHLGNVGFTDLAPQQQPFNQLWAARDDGSMVCAVYLPEERVLGFAERPMAEGVSVRSIVSITDPEGVFAQVWQAVEYGGNWHVLRMAPWRLDGEYDDTACMVDLGASYDGAPATNFTIPHLPNTDIAVVADGVLTRPTTDANGAFTLDTPASRVVAGLEFPAWAESLDFEAGGDNGPARGKKARFGRSWIEFAQSRGLAFGVPGAVRTVDTVDGSHVPQSPRGDLTGFYFRETVGPWTRHPRLRVERQAPHQATVLGWGGVLNMEKA